MDDTTRGRIVAMVEKVFSGDVPTDMIMGDLLIAADALDKQWEAERTTGSLTTDEFDTLYEIANELGMMPTERHENLSRALNRIVRKLYAITRAGRKEQGLDN